MIDAAKTGEQTLEILHLDNTLVICNKPSGLHSVPGRAELGLGSATQKIQALYPDAKVVHRLDMATSGLLVFARGLSAQRTLNQQFAKQQVFKRYVAVVQGLIPEDQGIINAPLMADWPARPRQKVDPAGKPSLTRYLVLNRQTSPPQTRVELNPETGRSHQLRVHLLHIGHAIVGDRLYAEPEVAQRQSRMLLHAQSIELTHPETGQRLKLLSQAPF